MVRVPLAAGCADQQWGRYTQRCNEPKRKLINALASMLMCRVSATADFYKERRTDSGWIGTKIRARTQILNALLLCLFIELAHALKRGLSFLFVFCVLWIFVRARFLAP